MAAGADRGIFFDEDFNLRIFEVDKFAASKSLQENSISFVSKLQSLQDLVSQYLAAIDRKAELIESEKLKAVGLRNKVATLSEDRKRREEDLQQLIADRQEQLARLQASISERDLIQSVQVEEQSLMKVISEQEAWIAKLADSNSGTAYL